MRRQGAFPLGGVQEPSRLQAIPETHCMGILPPHHLFKPLTIHTLAMLSSGQTYSLEP